MFTSRSPKWCFRRDSMFILEFKDSLAYCLALWFEKQSLTLLLGGVCLTFGWDQGPAEKGEVGLTFNGVQDLPHSSFVLLIFFSHFKVYLWLFWRQVNSLVFKSVQVDWTIAAQSTLVGKAWATNGGNFPIWCPMILQFPKSFAAVISRKMSSIQ